MTSNPAEQKIQNAQKIVNLYGDLLASLKHVNTALPESLLPAPKADLKQAIQTLLWELSDMSRETRSALVQAYVFLEQFLADDKVIMLAHGQAALQSADPEHDDWDYADEANYIVTQIKVAMENAMDEVRIYLPPQAQPDKAG